MTITGKGFYLWRIKACEGGDVEQIAQVSQDAGLSHILIKIADGKYSYNYDWKEKVDFVPPLVKALKKRGISPWGWHYVRGDDPVGEARKAIDRVKALDLEGYVIDAEGEYKSRHGAAKTFMNLVRRNLPNTQIALSSYRYPSLHPRLPWKEFLNSCDLNMPQVYWQGSHNPEVQLERCLEEFKKLSPQRPVIPTGAAYSEHSWTPEKEEVEGFLNESQRQGLKAANFWEWSAARSVGLWDVVAKYEWNGGPPRSETPMEPVPTFPTPPPREPGNIIHDLFDAMNSRKPDNMIRFYHPDVTHANRYRVVKGSQEVLVWYAQLFVQILPMATFHIQNITTSGAIRKVRWTARSPSGMVQNGDDTFLIVDGKIGYHFTYFTITQSA